MKSYSQAGQDLFAGYLLPCTVPRTFFDVGCSHPTQLSNTFALEQLGWRGWLFDNDENACALCRMERQATVICGDATTVDYRKYYTNTIDYLSLDIDTATLPALVQLLKCGVRFRVATIEHDSYRFGEGPRDEMRAMLRKDYSLVCADVRHSGLAFEDWYVEPALAQAATRFWSTGLDYKDILGDLLGGAQ